jgi:hypothetical protein
MNYTKGKWYILVEQHETSIEAESQTICTNVSNCDADLISAAPNMYEALKAWDNYATKNYPENMKLKRIAWDLTELALAKAEGK